MRRFLLLGLGVFLSVALIAAQDHSNVYERPAKDTITLMWDLMVGTQVLPAGEYRVVCDREKISFTLAGAKDKAIEVACRGRELPAKVEASALYTSRNADGVRVLNKMLLRGSNVEHVFK